MSENSNPIPLTLRAVAAAAGLGLILSGCSESSSANQGQQPALGGVVAEDGRATPTDMLANQIALLQSARTEVLKPEANLDLLEQKVKALPLGASALQATMQFKRAEQIMPIPGSATGKIAVTPGNYQKAVNQIADPNARKAYQDIFKSGILRYVLNGVRFNDMEQDEARGLLDAVEPGLSAKHSDTLDELDVSNAVIYGYYDPKTILGDIGDVRNASLKQKATLYANTPPSSKKSWKYYEELTKRGDVASTIADQASHSYFTEASEEKQRINSGGLVDAAVRDALVKHNAIASPPATVILPPLQNPAKNIDLRDVRGPKAYYALGEKQIEPLHQFAEVYVKDGKVTLHFEDGSNVGAESAAQLQRIVDDVTPLMTNAFAAGDLLSIRFIIGKQYNPYFIGREKEVHMLLAKNDPLSEEQLRQGLVHEVTHAMVDAAFGEVVISKEEAGLVKNACKLLSDETYKQYQQALQLDAGALQRLVEKSDGDVKKVFVKLQELVASGTLTTITASDMATSVVTERNINWTDCNDANFASLLLDVGYAAKVTDPSSVYDRIKAQFAPALNDPVTAANSTTASQTTAKNDTDFMKILDGWTNAIHKESLFKKLNESSFSRTESWVKEYLGHSRDNAHELMATVVDVSLSNPRELVALIRALGADERKAVIAAINASYFVITKMHPNIGSSLTAWKKQFTSIA